MKTIKYAYIATVSKIKIEEIQGNTFVMKEEKTIKTIERNVDPKLLQNFNKQQIIDILTV